MPHANNSALITIDTQNDFTLDHAPAQIDGTREVIPYMVQLLDSYRMAGLPIIHVVRIYLPDGSNVDPCRREMIEEGKQIVLPGSEGAELVKELMPDSKTRLNADVLLAGEFQRIGGNEFVMYKPRWGAFYGTRLEEFLSERKLDTLVFTGCNFPNCPRASIYEASERDFRVILAKDAMSQLYSKGEEEMKNIGVSLLGTHEIQGLLA